MLKHYLKIFLRNINRYKLYSTINYASLVLGLSFSLIVFLFLKAALVDDSFHQHYESVYQLEEPREVGSNQIWPRSFVDYIKQNISGVNEAFSVKRINQISVRILERENLEDILAASPGFFDVLSFDLLEGSEEVALQDPYSVYLTREKAQKFFGDVNPLGKTLNIYLDKNYIELYVAGIVADYPNNSSIKPDILISTRLLDQLGSCELSASTLCDSNAILFIPSAQLIEVEQQLKRQLEDINLQLNRVGENRLKSLGLSPFLDSIPYNHPVIFVLGFLCFLILGISCINYINNTLATTTTRFKEIGICKVMGSDRKGIALKFMLESTFSALIALILSLLLLELIIPYLNSHLLFLSAGNLTISLDPLMQIDTLPLLLGLIVVTAFLSGIWPAAKLSGLNPVLTLKTSNAVGGSPALSRYLVGFQLVISIIVLVLVLNTGNTMSAMDDDYYGYNPAEIMVVPVTEQAEDDSYISIYEPFSTRITGDSLNLSVAGMRNGFHGRETVVIYDGDKEYSTHIAQVTNSYFDLMEMTFSERASRLENPVTTDSSYVVINSVLLSQLGWERGGGHLLKLGGRSHTVIGVLNTFQGFEGVAEHLPFAFQLIPDSDATMMLVKTPPNSSYSDESIQAHLRSIRENFLREDHPISINSSLPYPKQERTLKLMIGWITPIGIFVLGLAFLGLFSLTSFSVNCRLKEISIRKVNGATSRELVRLLGRDYFILGCFAFVLALPLGYIASNKLLNFVTNTDALGSFFMLFGISLFFLLTFILLCVGYQVWKASQVNPTKYLRKD